MIMAKVQKPKPVAKVTSNGARNNGKALKQNPKTPKSTGRTSDGLSPAALERRAARRSQPYVPFIGLVSSQKSK